MTTEVATLDTAEAKALAKHESTIQRGLSTFYEVGAALLAIRDGKLYRSSHRRFEDYCQERWKMSKPRAYQLIEAAETQRQMSTIVDKLPANEAQARTLSKVPKEDRAEIWEKVLESAPIVNGEPKITAKHVEKIVAEELAEEDPVAQHDYLGQEVPAKLAAVFEAEELFDLAIGHAKALTNSIKQAAESPAGGFLNTTQVNRLVREVREIVNGARPYALCPYCHGRKCSACAQSGIVPKEVLEQAQAEE